jgi:Ca-activated chloride channel family protein
MCFILATCAILMGMKWPFFALILVPVCLGGLLLPRLNFLQLGQPLGLLALTLIPVVLWLLRHWLRQQQHSLHQLVDSWLLPRLHTQGSYRPLLIARSILLMAMVACLAMALARPQGNIVAGEQEQSGIDLLFALDVSDSSRATDVHPSRLEASKYLVRQMLQQLTSDRVGLIVFTNEAAPVAPLTTDYGALDTILNDITPGFLPSRGTQIGAAITAAEKRFAKSGDTGKILVIISDGENQDPDSLNAALGTLAKKDWIVFTIGAGTPQGARIPVEDPIFSRLIYKRYPTEGGEEVITKLDEATLKRLAERGRGKYLPIQKANQLPKLIEQARSTLQKQSFSSSSLTREERFQAWLLLALLLFTLERSIVLWENRWQQVLQHWPGKLPRRSSEVSNG